MARPPKEVVLNEAAYFSQLTNDEIPFGSCNLTCIAMALATYGIPQKTEGRYPDELIDYCQAKGLDQESPAAMAKIFNDYANPHGWEDEFTYSGAWLDLQLHIASGGIAIVHGYFTDSGHIVLVRGYEKSGGGISCWRINDPYGEWYPEGYDLNGSDFASATKGKNVAYSDDLMRRCCHDDGDLWWHQIRKIG